MDNYAPSGADPKWLTAHGGRDSFGNEQRSRVNLVPVDPVAMAKVIDPGRVEGNIAVPGVIITREQARARGLKVGTSLRFREDLLRIINGKPQYREPVDIPIVAIVERLPFYGEQFAVTRSLFSADPDSRVFFNFDPNRRAQVLDEVQNLLDTPAYRQGRLNDLTAALEADRQGLQQRMGILWAVTVVIFLIAAFGLFNAMVTSLQQRRRELATLRAVGATPGQIIRQVILEGVLTGLAGTVLGLVAGFAFSGAAWVALYDGGNFSLLTGLNLYLAALGIGPLLALAASLPPALRSAHTHVARSLAAD
jgi:putative ABC transport system permease protein